jgi:hypothetical protein
MERVLGRHEGTANQEKRCGIENAHLRIDEGGAAGIEGVEAVVAG